MSQRRRAQSKKGHQNGKQRIVDEAKRNTFDRNPLLNTAHQAVCKNCGNRIPLIYLDYLKSGRFKLGEAKTIEALQAYASGFVYEKEQATPIIIEFKCVKCKSKNEVKPVSFEYLLFTIGKSRSEHIYG
jgi:DNA-directed RNA polymerase subunit RPC12/RpoP